MLAFTSGEALDLLVRNPHCGRGCHQIDQIQAQSFFSKVLKKMKSKLKACIYICLSGGALGLLVRNPHCGRAVIRMAKSQARPVLSKVVTKAELKLKLAKLFTKRDKTQEPPTRIPGVLVRLLRVRLQVHCAGRAVSVPLPPPVRLHVFRRIVLIKISAGGWSNGWSSVDGEMLTAILMKMAY